MTDQETYNYKVVRHFSIMASVGNRRYAVRRLDCRAAGVAGIKL